MKSLNRTQELNSQYEKLQILKIFHDQTKSAYKHSPDWVKYKPYAEEFLNFDLIHKSENFYELKTDIQQQNLYHSSFVYFFALAAKLGCEEVIEIGSELGFTPIMIFDSLYLFPHDDKNLHEKFANQCLEPLLKLGVDPLSKYGPSSDIYNTERLSLLKHLIRLEKYEIVEKILDIKMKNPESLSEEELKQYSDYKSYYESSSDLSKLAKKNLLYAKQKIFSACSKSNSILLDSDKPDNSGEENYINEKNEQSLKIFQEIDSILDENVIDSEQKYLLSSVVKLVVDNKPQELRDLISEVNLSSFEVLDIITYSCHNSKQYNILLHFARSLDSDNGEIEKILINHGINPGLPNTPHDDYYQLSHDHPRYSNMVPLIQNPNDPYRSSSFDCPDKVDLTGAKALEYPTE